MDHVIRDHVDEALLVAEGVEPDPPGIGVLVDESFAVSIDEDAPGQAVRWAEGERALERSRAASSRRRLRRPCGCRVRRRPECRCARPGRHMGRGALLRHHGVVVDEPAAGQDHPATGPDDVGPSSVRTRTPTTSSPSTINSSARVSTITLAPLVETACRGTP